MTTQSWSSVVDHTSDAGFRAWGSEFAAKLAAVGLVQTADTGQINWTTVTRAGTNSDAGYEIWTFNDTQQGTAPIYIRFDYGTASTTSMPRIRATIGTGSNGSGTITGTAKTAANAMTTATAPASTVTAYQSYMCAVDGFFGVYWKAASGPHGSLLICRSCDSDGVATATAAIIYWGANVALTGVQALRFAASAAAYTLITAANQGSCLVPLRQSNSLVGSDTQAYMHWMITPQVKPVFGFCTIFTSEISLGSTFNTTLVGSTARTYIALSSGAGVAETSSATGSCALAMLWE